MDIFFEVLFTLLMAPSKRRRRPQSEPIEPNGWWRVAGIVGLAVAVVVGVAVGVFGWFSVRLLGDDLFGLFALFLLPMALAGLVATVRLAVWSVRVSGLFRRSTA